MVQFTHIHSSGRFNQPPNQFEQGLAAYRAIASVITVTEVDNNARAKLLTERHAHWQGVWGDHGPRDDCGITWDTDVWEKVWAATLPASQYHYKNERNWETGTTYAAFAVLQNKVTGVRVLFGSLHTPHGMQTELRTNNVHSDVARAYVKITTAYRNKAARLALKYKVDATVLSGDWNLNIRVLWARTWLRTYASASGLKLNWTGQLPVRGTHGKEIIDASLYKGLILVGSPVVLPNNVGDDHTAYKQIFKA